MTLDVATLRPSLCVECGKPHHNGGGQVGFGFGVVGSDELDLAPVPGLFRCAKCSEAYRGGQLESRIDVAEALEYLMEHYIPKANHLLNSGDVRLTADMRERLEGELNQATRSIITIVAWITTPGGFTEGDPVSGYLNADGSITLDPESEFSPKGWREVALKSIEVDEDGNATFRCPNCDKRHPAELLFDNVNQFSGIESDTKD